MSTGEKSDPRRQQAARASANRPSLASVAKSAAKDAIKDAIVEKRPYLKYAFANPYNLGLLGGGIAAALLTGTWPLAAIALGLEGLWLLHAPESKRLRKLLWDPRFESFRKEVERREREQRMAFLSPAEKERVETLVAKQDEIHRLASSNPSFTGELLRGELAKTGRLVDSFIDMAITCARYEEYLRSVDVDALERSRQRWEREVRTAKAGEPQAQVAKKNFEIVLKRLDKVREIRNYLSVARGQLDLIENSFQLIADQIVTMQSPTQLSGQLDELLDGVESIRETAADTERILGAIEERF